MKYPGGLQVAVFVFGISVLFKVAESLHNPLGPHHFEYRSLDSGNEPQMKAWTCHGRNQYEMVDRLRQAGIVQSQAVRAVMQAVDRGNYMSKNPYQDSPQSIGLGQTISAPHMHARVLEEIYPYLLGKEGSEIRMLDVGSGSGYVTAAFGRWLQGIPSKDGAKYDPILGQAYYGKVFGLDVHRELISLAKENMAKSDRDLLESGIVHVEIGDGWEGLPSEGPFDVIHVGAAADGLPYKLINQLKVGGVMIIPVGAQSEIQNLYKIERTSQQGENANVETAFEPKDFRMTSLHGVRYVPMVHPTH